MIRGYQSLDINQRVESTTTVCDLRNTPPSKTGPQLSLTRVLYVAILNSDSCAFTGIVRGVVATSAMQAIGTGNADERVIAS